MLSEEMSQSYPYKNAWRGVESEATLSSPPPAGHPYLKVTEYQSFCVCVYL